MSETRPVIRSALCRVWCDIHVRLFMRYHVNINPGDPMLCCGIFPNGFEKTFSARFFKKKQMLQWEQNVDTVRKRILKYVFLIPLIFLVVWLCRYRLHSCEPLNIMFWENNRNTYRSYFSQPVNCECLWTVATMTCNWDQHGLCTGLQGSLLILTLKRNTSNILLVLHFNNYTRPAMLQQCVLPINVEQCDIDIAVLKNDWMTMFENLLSCLASQHFRMVMH